MGIFRRESGGGESYRMVRELTEGADMGGEGGEHGDGGKLGDGAFTTSREEIALHKYFLTYSRLQYLGRYNFDPIQSTYLIEQKNWSLSGHQKRMNHREMFISTRELMER